MEHARRQASDINTSLVKAKRAVPAEAHQRLPVASEEKGSLSPNVPLGQFGRAWSALAARPRAA